MSQKSHAEQNSQADGKSPAQQKSQVTRRMAGLRLRRAERRQIQMQMAALDDLLDEEHRARWIWQAVQSLDLLPLDAQVASRQHEPGKPHTDPAILLTLWVLASLERITSAREIERLCRYHLAYRWVCGGVPVDHNMLSKFRAEAGIHEILVRLIGSLLHARVVTLEMIAQDGIKTRAGASRNSFQEPATLQESLEAAQTLLTQLEQKDESREDNSSDHEDGDHGDDHLSSRAARLRRRLERLQAALDEAGQLQAQRERQVELKKKKQAQPAKTSSTDPQARIMKFAHGGFLPAYNVQFATDVGSSLVVGVDVSQQGSDTGQLRPMYETLLKDYQRRPDCYLVDGGYRDLEDIDHLERAGCQVYAPVLKPKSSRQLRKSPPRDPYAREKRDTDGMYQWRSRMQTAEAKAIYRRRSQVAELTNAHARNRCLQQLRVRGLKMAQQIASLAALAHNLLHLQHLPSWQPT